jgi:hypothetical protein
MNDYGRPVRDDYEDWRDSVERDWERQERLDRVDEKAAKDEPVEESDE